MEFITNRFAISPNKEHIVSKNAFVVVLVPLPVDPQAVENISRALKQLPALLLVARLLTALQEQAVGLLSAGVLHLVIKR